ncbi:MAG: rhomboid family intramembrane serine protease [Anaerolineales bacterium]|nr:rhomboid family intramembrane serine protease [Anaerolineales bacterium]
MNQYPPSQPTPQQPLVRSTPVKPYLTYILLGVTVAVYLVQMITESLVGIDLPSLFGIKFGPLIRSGQLWRLITPVFLHGSIVHIAMNMYGLVLFGPRLETRFGRWRFSLLYLLSAYAGNVMSFLLTPNPSLGASTAIFGMLAAEGMFLVQNRELLTDRGRSQIGSILLVAGYNLLYGFLGSGIDNWGHIGGLLGGLLFTWFGGPRLRVEGIYPAYRLVDERQGHGALSGAIAVLLFFIPLTLMGWIWPLS